MTTIDESKTGRTHPLAKNEGGSEGDTHTGPQIQTTMATIGLAGQSGKA